MEEHIRSSEIISALKREINSFAPSFQAEDAGEVIQCGDGVAKVYGLNSVMSGELVEIEVPGHNNVVGIALNLEEDFVGVVLLDEASHVKEGHIVRRSKAVAQVPVGEELLGRVIDPLGRPLDEGPELTTKNKSPIERNAPGIVDRENVCESLFTGIKAIDALIPIGRGQRELIIGDRRTGKTAIAIDAIINQARSKEPVYCFYVAIGQKRSSVVRVVEKLKEFNAMRYTTVVCATASDPAAMQYLAPYSACAMAEYFRDSGRHALIIYDDLTKQAQAYRQISLLLRRPPGREAYPGDIFYLHSRLLERAAKLSVSKGGGSLTALPIIETQAGDISAYIPTNVVSITDGQIFLESNLFNSGLRPAINVGISVSRVGGSAQIKAMKQVAGSLRLNLAQFRELASFSQFSSDLDKSTRFQLLRGEKLTEMLKQAQYRPVDAISQVMIILAGTKGYLDDCPTNKLFGFERHFLQYLSANHSDFLSELAEKKAFDAESEKKACEIIEAFKKVFDPAASLESVDSGVNLGIIAATTRDAHLSQTEIIHMIEQVAINDFSSPSLNKEISNLLTQEGEEPQSCRDIFDITMEKAQIIDFDGDISMEDLFKHISPILAKQLNSDEAVVFQKLIAREKLSSTALTPDFAVPHMIIPGKDLFAIMAVRCRKGVRMSVKAPNVRIFFFLGGSMDSRTIHLLSLATIAQIVNNADFVQRWDNAKNSEELRSIILTTPRIRRKG
jgi:F-type H+-transporting ATPase subunit alpha